MLFPRLQPLVAALGWDLLAGKTAMRRELMQSLWASKSQALRLEESSPYDNKLDEVIFPTLVKLLAISVPASDLFFCTVTRIIYLVVLYMQGTDLLNMFTVVRHPV